MTTPLPSGVAAPVPVHSASGQAAGSPESKAHRPPTSGLRFIRLCAYIVLAAFVVFGAVRLFGFDVKSTFGVFEQLRYENLPADGRSNLNGNAATVTYTTGSGLTELISDEHWNEGPNDGARWELRTSAMKGYNSVSVAHYIFVPRLDNAQAVNLFVAKKNREHRRLAGQPVSYREIAVDGRKGYEWNHMSRGGYWYFAAWFPQPTHTVRVECIAKKQQARFRNLCAEAMHTLKFNQ